jgi:hypothetical protein
VTPWWTEEVADDHPEPALWDEEMIQTFKLKPWQERLMRRIASAPKGTRFILLMPPQGGRR